MNGLTEAQIIEIADKLYWLRFWNELKMSAYVLGGIALVFGVLLIAQAFLSGRSWL